MFLRAHQERTLLKDGRFTVFFLAGAPMSPALDYGANPPQNSARHDDHDLCTRVCAEFQEMPGLRLTLPQAARLFSIEPHQCERILGALVRSGHLASDGKTFVRSRAGRRCA
jgi:hypothetical protein